MEPTPPQPPFETPTLERAPIPSPVESAVPDIPSQTANYVIAALVALAAGIVLWFASGAIGIVPVASVVLGLYMLGGIAGTAYLARTGKSLHWQVRCQDLPMVRGAVDGNMKCAYAMMTVVWPFLLVATARGAAYLWIVVMLYSIPFSVWSTGVEKKFKTMPADDAAAEYQDLIAQWKEPRFGVRK